MQLAGRVSALCCPGSPSGPGHDSGGGRETSPGLWPASMDLSLFVRRHGLWAFAAASVMTSRSRSPILPLSGTLRLSQAAWCEEVVPAKPRPAGRGRRRWSAATARTPDKGCPGECCKHPRRGVVPLPVPSVQTMASRKSSITNAFVSAIIPVIAPTHEEALCEDIVEDLRTCQSVADSMRAKISEGIRSRT